MLPCPLRSFATFRTWIEALDLGGSGPEIMLTKLSVVLAYGSEQARFVQPLWEKEY
jgi:hypothetical protein